MRLRFVLIGPGEAASASLAAALTARGHEVVCHAPRAAFDLAPARGRMAAADAVILDAATPDQIAVGAMVLASAGGMTALRWSKAADLAARLAADVAPAASDGFDMVLSPIGGPALRQIERAWSARQAVAFYPAATPPGEADPVDRDWALGYLEPPSPGTCAARDSLFVSVARRFPNRRFLIACDAAEPDWPANIETIAQPEPDARGSLLRRLEWSLHLTHPALARAGCCPDAAMFEAAVAGTGVICEGFPGIGTLLEAGTEIVLADGPRAVAAALSRPPAGRCAIAAAGRARVMAEHLFGSRAAQLEALVLSAAARRRDRPRRLAF